jgi:hypothetical protein
MAGARQDARNTVGKEGVVFYEQHAHARGLDCGAPL